MSLSPVSDAPRTHCTTAEPGWGWSGKRSTSSSNSSGSVSTQLSRNAARSPSTAGPWMRKCVSRHSRSFAGVAVPLVGDADAAGEADRLVDDHHLAVRSMVHLTGPEPAERAEPAQRARRRRSMRSSEVVSIGRAPQASSSTRTRTPARARSASASANWRADLALPVDERQEVDGVARRSSIASSIAGKISSPLRRTSMRLPSVAGTPMTPSRVRAQALSSRPRRVGLGASSVVTLVARQRQRCPPAAPARSGSECSTFSASCGLRDRRRGPLRAARRPRRRTARRPPRAATRAAARRCRPADRRSGRTTCSTRRTAEAGGHDEPASERPRRPRRTRATKAPAGAGAATTGRAS